MPGGNGVGFGLHQPEKRIGHPGLRGEVIHFIIQEKASGGSDVRTIAVVECVGAGDGVTGGIYAGKMSRVRAFAEACKRFPRGRGTRSDAASMRTAGFDAFARWCAPRRD